MRISGVSLSGKRADAHEGEFLVGTEAADVVGEGLIPIRVRWIEVIVISECYIKAVSSRALGREMGSSKCQLGEVGIGVKQR